MKPSTRVGAWEEITAEKLQAELDKYSQEMLGNQPRKIGAIGSQMQAAQKMLLNNAQAKAATLGSQAQAQAYRKALSDINPTLAEINSPDSPMALSIPTMLTLWKQRHGYKWVSEEEIVKDEYWAVVARRLHGLHMLERMEASLGSIWDRTSVFRLKDDDANY